jgi:hypothetical protein
VVVGLGTEVVTVEAGNVIVVSEPKIDVVIVKAGSVNVEISISVVAKQSLLAKSSLKMVGRTHSHGR